MIWGCWSIYYKTILEGQNMEASSVEPETRIFANSHVGVFATYQELFSGGNRLKHTRDPA